MFTKHHKNDLDIGIVLDVIGEKKDEYGALLHRAKCGRPLYSGCLEKAVALQSLAPEVQVVLGRMYVYNKNFSARYGFEYRLEAMEFHAWATLPGGIVLDPSLGGVIMRGLQLYDEAGCFLEGRTPCLLAGVPPKWAEYDKKETLSGMMLRTGRRP